MKKLYLIAAVVGAIVPYIFFFNFIQLNGVDIPGFVSALFVNGAAGGFSADLLVSSFVFWIFMFQQQQKIGPKPWVFIILNLLIGLSCALPAYLCAREKSE
jgi:hypothetical protein